MVRYIAGFHVDRSQANAAMPFTTDQFRAAADDICTLTRELAARGWTPATSINFSIRLDEDHAAITISGRDKGRLTPDDIMVVDLDGKAVGSSHRPSAETLLHTQLYARDASMGCVLHTHSKNQTLASRLFAADGLVRFDGYELLKAFPGITTHETTLDLPIFPNTQHMPDLAAQVEATLQRTPNLAGYLINGHGLYAYGRTVFEARRHLDAFEFLLDCELTMRTLKS